MASKETLEKLRKNRAKRVQEVTEAFLRNRSRLLSQNQQAASATTNVERQAQALAKLGQMRSQAALGAPRQTVQKAAEQTAEATSAQKQSGGMFSDGKIDWYNPLDWLGYLVENAGSGLLRFGEGIYDFAAGGIASLAGQNQYAESLHKDDVSGRYQQSIQERYNPSKAMGAAGSLIETVANMIPAIVATYFTGGAAGAALLGASAAGRGTTQSYQHTGELGAKEYAYGIGSGLLETGIEYASGGIGGVAAKAGGKLLGTTGGKIVKNQLVRNMIGEGLEEVASTAIDPYLQRLTYNPDAENAKFEEYAQSFVLGAAASGVLQGLSKVTMSDPMLKRQGTRIIQNNKVNDLIEQSITLDGTKSQEQAQKLRRAVDYGEEVKPLDVGRLGSQLQIDMYNSEVDALVEGGMKKKSAEKQVSEAITETVRQERFDYKAYTADVNQQEALKQGFKSDAITTKDLEQLTNVRQKLGIENVEFYYDPNGENGMYAGGKMRINTAKGNLLLQTGIHEYLHDIEINNAASFNAFKSAVMELTRIPQYQSRAAQIRQMYTNDARTQGMSAQVIENEVAVNLAMDLISDKAKLDAFLKDIGTERRSLLERLARFFKGLYERLKGSPDAKPVREAYNALVRVLKDSAQSAEAGGARMQAATARYGLNSESINSGGEKRYSLDPENPAEKILIDKYNEYVSKHKSHMYALKASTYQKLIEAGKRDYLAHEAKFGDIRSDASLLEWRDFIYNKEADIYDRFNDQWAFAAYKAGADIARGRYLAEFDTSEKIWERFGEPRRSESPISDDFEYLPSYNYRDKRSEEGVSVMDDEWKESMNYIWFSRKTEYLVKGIQISWGSDGEPVIIPTAQAVKREIIENQKLSPSESRYSLDTDSQGRKLSLQQQEFFKDSKVRDEQGRLLEVYHDTNAKEYVNTETGQKWDELTWEEKEKWEQRKDWDKYWKENDFYAFNRDRARQGIEMPAYFFATTYDKYHEYGNRTIKAYLNITNPAINPVIKNAGVTDTAGKVAMDNLIKQGHDGFLRTDDDGNISEYGVFNSNQIKLTTNLNPTASEDIRYSLDTEKAKLRARTRPGKEYTRAEAKAIIDGIVGAEFKGKALSELSKPDTKRIVNKLYAGLNAAKEGQRAPVALGVADMLIDSTQNDFTGAERSELRQSIAQEILDGYESQGRLTKFGATVEKYSGKITALRAELKDAKKYGKAAASLMETVRIMKDLKGVAGAARRVAEEFKPITKAFKSISGTDKKGSEQIRAAFKAYAQRVDFDGKSVPLYNHLGSVEGEVNPFAETIESIASKTGRLSSDELLAARQVLRNYIHNAREYGKVLIDGQRQDAKDLSSEGISQSREVKARKNSGPLSWVRDYMDWTSTPVWVFRRMSNYDDSSALMRLYKQIVEGVNERDAIERDMQLHFADFFNKHGKALEKWRDDSVPFAGGKISKGQAISLHLLSKRAQAQTHLYNVSDFAGVIRITDEKGGSAKQKYQRGKDISFTNADVEALSGEFTEADKEFIKLTQQFFGTLSKDTLNKAYQSMYGVDIANEDNYFPIHVSEDELYREIGGKNPGDFGQIFAVRNPSFIQPTVKNPQNKVVIENALDVLNKHMHDVASFSGLALPVRNMNRVLNSRQDSGETLLKSLDAINPKFRNYLDKWLKDIQGIRTGEHTALDSVLGKLRGMSARAALGLNPKVWANQFVSLFASRGVGISYKNILHGGSQMAKAKKADFDLLYKYVPMAYTRARDGANIDVGLLKEGTGLLGKADQITELSTALIQKIDNRVVYGVWQAALKQTESQHTPNSEAHYKAAAELTKRAITETQANYSAAFRPEILRTNNELLRLSTMFMSEPLQVFSQIAGNIDAVLAARRMKANASTAAEKTRADKMMKASLGNLRSVAISTTVTALLLVLITRMADWLKGKNKDEEESFWAAAGNDLLSNYTGMFPLVRDFHSFLQGYDVTNMYQTGIQNIFEGITNLADMVSGEGNAAQKARKTLLGVSQLFGVPLRNLETYTMGVIDKFSPETAYQYNSLFYQQAYKKNLDKAVTKGDTSMANAVMSSYMRDKGLDLSDYVAKEFARLYSKGALTLPTGLKSSVTVNGETINMTQSEYQRFASVYSAATEVAQSIVASHEYKSLADEAKGKALNVVFDMYYAKAKTSVLSAGDYKYAALTAVPIRQFAPIAGAVSAITTEEGSATRKAQIKAIISKYGLTVAQRLFLMMYFGYAAKDGDFAGVTTDSAKKQVKAFIGGLSLSDNEKAHLLSKAGLAE